MYSNEKYKHLMFYLLTQACILLLSLFLTSCGKGSNSGDESEYVAFDKSLLGLEVVDIDLGLKFNPPGKWYLRQTMISRKIESRGDVSNPSDKFIYQPTYVFFNDSTGGLLSVGKVISSDTTLPKASKINYYKSLLMAKTPKENLTSASFVNSGIYFSQFKIQKENLSSFKLIFENSKNEIIQFDYTIRSDYLERMQRSIKSSIGSIRFM